jgi:DNA-binding NtrC family response regulator
MSAEGAKALVLDDDPVVLRAVKEILVREGYQVTALTDPIDALAFAQDSSLDVVITDVKMPNISGLDVLHAFKKAQPDVEVIMMTGFGTVETAVAAVKAGAYDFVTKPFERIEDFALRVAKAVERRTLKRRTQTLEQALDIKVAFEGIIGHSAQMGAVFKLVQAVAAGASTVLIQGESGTGKELVARAIHFRSPRAGKPFVAVNCSALTETLLDSELFGHIKGSFTGAVGNKKGLFEAAEGGTLFLDEIGDIPPPTQVRLLRALQEGEIKRVGATDTVRVDVRVIAATNVDLAKARAEGRFREDLYYRLNVINIPLPPLRDRPADIPLLVQHFLKKYSERAKRPTIPAVSEEAMRQLLAHRWPGNVRELENAIERAILLTSGPLIGIENVPDPVRESGKPQGNFDPWTLNHLPFSQAKELAMSAFERRYLSVALEKSQNNISAAALAAGMDRSNFRRLLKHHGLAKGQDRGPEDGDSGPPPAGPA